jgi:hypothetical protein
MAINNLYNLVGIRSIRENATNNEKLNAIKERVLDLICTIIRIRLILVIASKAEAPKQNKQAALLPSLQISDAPILSAVVTQAPLIAANSSESSRNQSSSNLKNKSHDAGTHSRTMSARNSISLSYSKPLV